MRETEIRNRVQALKEELSGGNPYGEKVTLVLATKMQTADDINAAIQAGADAVAENKVQEFREKTRSLLPCPQHFIGRLQTNKVKYLVGTISLFHSCDRKELAEEIAKQSLKRGVVSDVLMQVNAGREESKGGFLPERAQDAFAWLTALQGIRVRGVMAMLPETDDENLLRGYATEMRALFERLKTQADGIDYLSMGMSGDYKLCIECGSNMIRVGSTVFGARNYGV